MKRKLKDIRKALLAPEDSSEDKPFYAEDELTPADIDLKVEEVGQITFPLTNVCIQKLIGISSKALYGLREQTILDEKVRNTHEIKPNKLLSTINEIALIHMLNKMRQTFGIAENAILTPHLHNMLIYAPGHFFDLHQDTEKLEKMVATLVVVLPTQHIGGDLTIQLGRKEYIFSSENLDFTTAKCIAFYSDCKHKVDKVKFGYRVCLTYNLVLTSPGLAIKSSANERLKESMKRYFNLDNMEESDDSDPGSDLFPQEDSDSDQAESYTQTKKLVYLLDHCYTEQSLRWYMLKGNDTTNASEVMAVAKELDLVPHLALVDVLETWVTYDMDEYESDPQPDDIRKTSVSIYYWIDSDNKKLPYKELRVKADQISWNKKTSTFDPHTKEYEGYQGNYAGDIKIWYRRAAIVLWPRSEEVAMSFRLNYEEAVDLVLINIANESENRENVENTINMAGKYFFDNAYTVDKSMFEKFVHIACYFRDKAKALSVLSHFRWELLNSNISEQVFSLQTQYGPKFCIKLLNSWKKPENWKWSFFDGILKEIDSLVKSILEDGGHPEIVEIILDEQVKALIKKVDTKILSDRINLIYQTLSAIEQIQNVALLNRVIEHIRTNTTLYPEERLTQLYSRLKESAAAEFCVHFEPLKNIYS